VRRLQSHGVQVIPVGAGELASGLVGEGRLAEPEEIVAFVARYFRQQPDLTGKRALVTAGPTHEPLDPVRFLGNHSTGKMGMAIAEVLARRGAKVTLVLGPTALVPNVSDLQVIRVGSAQEMYAACAPLFPDMDITVLAAAVADYRPALFSEQKIKKKDDDLHLPLAKTVDIAATLGSQKKPGQILVGFALETNNEIEYARQKMERKNLDFIVLNSLQDAGAGFGHDTNKITILRRNGLQTAFELQTKTEAARDIVEEIVRLANPKMV